MMVARDGVEPPTPAFSRAAYYQYLIEQFARRAGKRITETRKKTLSLLQSYDLPGNTRELQNVIEHTVVLSEGKTLSVDETWLQRKSNEQPRPTVSPAGVLADDRKEFANRELKAIEAALAECRGRVSGPRGATAKLGIRAGRTVRNPTKIG